MENLNGHVTGNGGYSQGETFGNSPFFDPTDEGELEIEPSAATPALYSAVKPTQNFASHALFLKARKFLKKSAC
jgi:hypothetical protein